jgi:hypothetical protein
MMEGVNLSKIYHKHICKYQMYPLNNYYMLIKKKENG